VTRLVLVALLFGLASAAWADDPPLGRLFLTPQERALLDNARRNRVRAAALAAAADKKPKLPPVRDVTINGVVKRSDGEAIIWVNGRPTDGETDDGMHVAASPGTDASIVVREPEKGRKVRLKVGQRVDLTTGRIEENYEARRLQAAAVVGSEQSTPPEPPSGRARPQKRSSDNEKSVESESASDETPEKPANEAMPK
jgi:hypothetical protein